MFMEDRFSRAHSFLLVLGTFVVSKKRAIDSSCLAELQKLVCDHVTMTRPESVIFHRSFYVLRNERI